MKIINIQDWTWRCEKGKEEGDALGGQVPLE